MFRRSSVTVSKSLKMNKKYVQNQFEKDDDLFIRNFSIDKTPAFIAGIQGLVDKQAIAQTILAPLAKITGTISCDFIMNALSSVFVQEIDSLEQAIELMMYGNVALFVDGFKTSVVIDVSAFEQRSIEEPKNEVVIRGPHVGFIEDLTVNLSLIRRILHNKHLKVESDYLGQKTKNKIALLYVKGIAYPKLIDNVQMKLNHISVDAVLDSGYVEQLIEPGRWSFFPTVRHTERPSTVAASLLEGRIAILVDGSPTALLVPHLFLDNFMNPEDYNSRPFYSSMMRIVRLIGFFLSTQLPALYISIENFHKEVVPSSLLLSVAGAREGVPFPLPLESILMVFAFELIKETGIRMPQALGPSISLVAGLILGQAAVEAGFVGIPTVIIVALAGLSSFLIPFLKETIVLIRILLIIPASFVGLYGLILTDILILLHIVSLRSFGVPYLAPISPTYLEDWRDTFFRFTTNNVSGADKRLRHNIGKYIK
ncbi:spore germination protein [Fodinisporobacter ferrooxydans]|uniref:Spore germination protein n=1 Tax=Fodinisporobacter ferrooxydans TaxID=2901836 RepID=A0ABY4CF12_9BACL|nr:spore germination protein [Alicyclobacillaceae bacterium MYW30-H2]